MRKCRAVYMTECFSCKFSDCRRATSDKKKMIGELSSDIYLPLDYIHETQKMERAYNEQIRLLRFTGK